MNYLNEKLKDTSEAPESHFAIWNLYSMSKSDFFQKSSFSSYSKIVDYLQEFTVVPREVIQNGGFVRFFANIF